MKNNLVFGIIVGILLSFGLDIIAEDIIPSNGVSYRNSKTSETTVNGALNELFSAVDINSRLGDTSKISNIGDGTVSGAIKENANNVSSINENIKTINTNITNLTNKHSTDISNINTSLSGKQSTITGAASTITGSNLTANRALISNGSGKVAVSGTTSTELGYLSGVTSSVQTQLNGKQATISGAASTITGSNLTANRALISNGSGKVAISAVTSTELGYLDGVTSNVQTQLNTINNNLTTVIGKNNIQIQNALAYERYNNIVYIYGQISKDLSPGWNTIISKIPLDFEMVTDQDIHFVVINNAATSATNQFLQGKVSYSTKALYVYSWDSISAQLLFDAIVPVKS